ncbi:MAG TPA: MraY family glycosyltransferase [Rectinemataceae bacterium]|nr:MraY family glycosyltransferase [Rectinemataceae bacterium]
MPLISILLSCALASSLVPAILYFAHKQGLYDTVNERKIHNGNIPRLGGVGIAAAFLATIIILMLLQEPLVNDFNERYKIWPIVLAGFVMFFLGLIDDLVDLRARLKFLIQVLAALFLIVFGFRFKVIMVPWGNGFIDLGLFSYPITLLWIIGITNAMNLIDGLDGLAGGICFIASLTFGIFFWAQGAALSAELCLAVTGAVAGFLIFNLPPAKIFMGDSGSLFLGFCLAILPLLGNGSGDKVEIGFFSAVATLGIPIFDTFSAMYRRRKAGVSFFTADKGHLHHILLGKVKSTGYVLLIIYSINTCLALAALSTLYLNGTVSFTLKISAILALAIFFAVVNRKSGKTDVAL